MSSKRQNCPFTASLMAANLPCTPVLSTVTRIKLTGSRLRSAQSNKACKFFSLLSTWEQMMMWIGTLDWLHRWCKDVKVSKWRCGRKPSSMRSTLNLECRSTSKTCMALKPWDVTRGPHRWMYSVQELRHVAYDPPFRSHYGSRVKHVKP